MLIALSVLVLGSVGNLTKIESKMVSAISKRQVSEVRRLMEKQISLFTVLQDSNLMNTENLPENYLVASARFDQTNSDEEIKVHLERIAKIIAVSKSLQSVKSAHNDLTKHTIRGQISPGVYWELHYDVMRDGTLRVKRICEFDHSPKIVW